MHVIAFRQHCRFFNDGIVTVVLQVCFIVVPDFAEIYSCGIIMCFNVNVEVYVVTVVNNLSPY